MNTYEEANIRAIKDCTELIQKYPLDDCLAAANDMCQAIETGKLIPLLKKKRKSRCFNEIFNMATAFYGARNVLSALLYLKGDVDGAQLQLAAYVYASQRAAEDLKKKFFE